VGGKPIEGADGHPGALDPQQGGLGIDRIGKDGAVGLRVAIECDTGTIHAGVVQLTVGEEQPRGRQIGLRPGHGLDDAVDQGAERLGPEALRVRVVKQMMRVPTWSAVVWVAVIIVFMAVYVSP
jgi:hypothetical protein